jgi:hypothetical protein
MRINPDDPGEKILRGNGRNIDHAASNRRTKTYPPSDVGDWHYKYTDDRGTHWYAYNNNSNNLRPLNSDASIRNPGPSFAKSYNHIGKYLTNVKESVGGFIRRYIEASYDANGLLEPLPSDQDGPGTNLW